MNRTYQIFIFIIILTIASLYIALPRQFHLKFNQFGLNLDREVIVPAPTFNLFGKQFSYDFQLKQGLDIQGGMQVVVEADMSEIASSDRGTTLESAREIILRRVDLYGINEPSVTTSQVGESHRILVDLPGV